MNTFRIYEEFRQSLGEPAARSLATTLGAMFEELKDTVTKEDFRTLRESIDSDVNRLETAITGLAEAQQRTEARVEQLAEAQQRTEARVEQLAEAQQRTESELARLAASQQKLAEAQARTEEALQRLTIRVDRFAGRTMEMEFRERLPSYLGLFVRRAKLLTGGDLIDEFEPKLSRDELEDVLRADAIASGTLAGQPVHVVVEVSLTADADDVSRASRRAAALTRAGLQTIPIVACEAISPETAAMARREMVRVWLDGRLLDEAA